MTLQQRAGAKIEEATRFRRRWPKEFKSLLTRLPTLAAEVHLGVYLICTSFDLGFDLLSTFP